MLKQQAGRKSRIGRRVVGIRNELSEEAATIGTITIFRRHLDRDTNGKGQEEYM